MFPIFSHPTFGIRMMKPKKLYSVYTRIDTKDQETDTFSV